MLAQALKTAQFDSFFTVTWKTCEHHFFGEDASVFFDLLASQIMQRLVKSAVGAKGGKLNTQYVASFINEMVRCEANGDDQALDIARAVQAVLDPASAPERITEASLVIESSQHWLAKTFALENGKKVLRAAAGNAERRSEVNEIIMFLDKSLGDLKAVVEVVSESGNCCATQGDLTLWLLLAPLAVRFSSDPRPRFTPCSASNF